MTKTMEQLQHLPQSVKVSSDIGVWFVAISGWLGVFQPWLTALATLLAIAWTSMQIYSWSKRKR